MISSLPWMVGAALGCAQDSPRPEQAAPPSVRFQRGEDQQITQVEVLAGEEILLRSPPEGIWSIGVGWSAGEPVEWRHGRCTGSERQGDWRIVHGTVDTPQGAWEVRDSWRVRGEVVRCVRRWTWRGGDTSPPTTLSARWLIEGHRAIPSNSAPGTGRGVVLPGLLYHGNPSGRRSREEGWPGLVPLWSGNPGERAFFQEHRFPAPFVSFEWPDENAAGFGRGAALHSLPSPAPYAAVPDVWWSLGLRAGEDGTELALLSGVCVLNGAAGQVKSGQRDATAFDRGYLTVPAGAVIEKTLFLQGYPVSEQGSGFQRALRAALSIHRPSSTEGFPTVAEILRDKLRFALSRWRGDNPSPGFAMYPRDRDLYVMGWAGQSEAPGYALQVLAPRLGDPELEVIARRTLDALAQSPFDAHGFRLALNGRSGEWSRQDPVSQGQAMTAFARAIRVGRERGADTSAWEAFLTRACEVHAGRILAEDWHPRSTAEAFLISPLCLGAALLGREAWQSAAVKAAAHYAARHLSMEEPYWGGTLDARCEDKEGAWAAFEGFLAVFEATGEPRFLQAAEHAADVALTYTYLWDVDLPAGRLTDHALKTRGWTSVSVQNMHLDVFGVVYSPEVWRLGELTSRPELKRLAAVMYRSCGQMIDPSGSQGEQLQQTRFAQGGDLSDPDRYRGGYVEGWTVFWITAHFLTAAAKFEEMGVLDELW